MSRSAWELEIGTERFEDKGNHVLGDDEEINQVKNLQRSKKKGGTTQVGMCAISVIVARH